MWGESWGAVWSRQRHRQQESPEEGFLGHPKAERKPTQWKHGELRGEWAKVRLVHVSAPVPQRLSGQVGTITVSPSTKALISQLLFSPDSSALHPKLIVLTF